MQISSKKNSTLAATTATAASLSLPIKKTAALSDPQVNEGQYPGLSTKTCCRPT